MQAPSLGIPPAGGPARAVAILALAIGALTASGAGSSRVAAPLVLTNAAMAYRPGDAVRHATISPWTPLFLGVEACEGTTTNPRPVRVHALRIDLHEPTIDFLVTPSNGDAPKDVGARTTSEFLAEFKCQAAINGSVFDVFARSNGHPMDVQGLSLSRGDEYSPPNEWDALLLGTNRNAWIARSPVDTTGAWNGLSGFFAILYQGTNYGTLKDRHPRSVAGVSKDRRYLILMVVDGRQPGYSEGVTTAEAADWAYRLGAYDALNLDGGGSSALVVQGEDGAPRTLNRPCGPPVGMERRVANHLGVFARPLP
ncbi:MAG TPA: phosphodiester glycosidase family protein [Verrucomicrobiota bacterium]|nr:phosphodiester glycosidase family protein [Verrucomicrobiota bacterium]HRT56465.1 phosphodiester glycosidase family protein [Candidatus Paceibacterota bacterium]